MADRLMDDSFRKNMQRTSDGTYKVFKMDAQQKFNNNSLFYEAPLNQDYRYVIDYAKYIQSRGGLSENPYDQSNDPNNNKPLSINPKTVISPVGEGENGRIDVDELVSWSQKLTNGKLRYQDFGFCKQLGAFPSNRTVILRRFPNPIKDNLFDSRYEMKPVSTMLTWVPPDKMAELLKFTFHENWTGYNLDFMDMLKGIFNSNSGKSVVGGLMNTYVDADYRNLSEKGLGLLEDLVTYAFLDKLGETSTGNKNLPSLLERFPEGNPNIIKEASMRLLSNKTSASNLSGVFKFNLEFEFECNRYLADIDPSIAFLDLLSNAMRMSTSDAEFKLPPQVGDDFTQALVKGDLSRVVTSVLGGFQQVISDSGDAQSSQQSLLSKFYDSIKGNNLGESLKDTGNKVFKALVSKYVEEIKAAYSVMTGAPSGLWHLTVGNPKSPIVSIGDLIVESSTITFGTELGYNDMPTSFKYNISLRSARNRGRQEIEQIFNSGRGRIYKRAGYSSDGKFTLSSFDDAFTIRDVKNSVADPPKLGNNEQTNDKNQKKESVKANNLKLYPDNGK